MPKPQVEIKESLDELFQKSKKYKKDWSEEDLRVALIKTDILKILGYKDEDIRYEKSVRQKRTDIQCFDDFGIVTLVIECKKPSVSKLKEHKPKLMDNYLVPLKARYGMLINGLQLILYERVGLNEDIIIDMSLEDITLENCDKLYNKLWKQPYKIDKLSEVAKYFELFFKKEERRKLYDELSRELFFEDFALKKGTYFSELITAMITLFDHQYKEESFLTSAYNFWKRSYARKPDKVPKNWKPIMEKLDLKGTEENLYKFMFCLETAYALFTRLILAKTCEDYEFPDINLYKFLESDMRTREYKGEITAVGWGISLVGLIEGLRYQIVESIFEEDIFYWWTDEFTVMRNDRGEFLKKQWDSTLIKMSTSIRDIIYALYKYDFSEIAGDPLGDLYQKYFDRDTRKALGEFYTPKEVVNYILNAIDYKGRYIVDKRLLDPATGSGTFIVDALRKYLDAAEPEANKNGWGPVIEELCNGFHIVAFDIHPFATIMAQIHFMLELLPKYKIAMEEDKDKRVLFRIKRIPIFRTDSLVDERKGGRVDLTSIEDVKKGIQLEIPLPIKGKLKDEAFSKINIIMPRPEDVRKKTDLIGIPQYFRALQAIFDVVKKQVKKGKYEMDKELLRRTFKEYLEDKDWERLVNFFEWYCDKILEQLKKFKEPPYKFGNGRLVKSVEDVMFAGLLKNYVKYDYVVGNPPYVRKEKISQKYKKNILSKTYPDVYHGDNDLSIYFISRAIEWLVENGNFGYIVSGKFIKTRYGKYIRAHLIRNTQIEQLIDLRGSKVFSDATNDPIILIFKNEYKEGNKFAYVINIKDISSGTLEGGIKKILSHIDIHLDKSYQDKYIWSCKIQQDRLLKNVLIEEKRSYVDEWKLIPQKELEVFNKIKRNSSHILKEPCDVYFGIKSGGIYAFRVWEKEIKKLNFEEEILKPTCCINPF